MVLPITTLCLWKRNNYHVFLTVNSLKHTCIDLTSPQCTFSFDLKTKNIVSVSVSKFSLLCKDFSHKSCDLWHAITSTDLVVLHRPIRDGVDHCLVQVGPANVDRLPNQLLSKLEQILYTVHHNKINHTVLLNNVHRNIARIKFSLISPPALTGEKKIMLILCAVLKIAEDMATFTALANFSRPQHKGNWAWRNFYPAKVFP